MEVNYSTKTDVCYCSFSSNLGNNPLTCDCDLYGLYNTSKYVSKFYATCAKPLSLATRELKSMKFNDFCSGKIDISTCFIVLG